MIRKHKVLFSLLACCTLMAPVARAAAHSDSPVTLINTTYMPEIVGDFDHFAVDLKRGHLFLSAEVHHSIEMFDLKTGSHLQSIDGFKTPHSIAFAPEKDELLVADGGDSALVLVSGEDFHRLDRIPLIDGSVTGKGDSPDAAYYDASIVSITLAMEASQPSFPTRKFRSSRSIRVNSLVPFRFLETMSKAWESTTCIIASM